jgi:SAM-dependent methyltransferase
MREFWDDRARDDAFYAVDNRLTFRDPDVDRFWAEGEKDLRELLESVGADVEPSDRVVEIGCGLGRLTRCIAARAKWVDAIDISAEMLERAAELNPELENVAWLRGDGLTLGVVEDASASLCVSHVVFQHAPDPQITLGYVREMGRILADGGRAVFGLSNDFDLHVPWAPEGRLPRLRLFISQLRGHQQPGVRDPAWVGSAVDLDELRAVASEAGLEIERIANEGTQYCVIRARRAERGA